MDIVSHMYLNRALIFSLLVMLSAHQARAEAFFIELGRAQTEAEAQGVFSDLKSKNDALADYDVFPNAILMPDGSFTYRVQAGPMLDKAEANKVCNRLSKRKVSCFVIEGFDPERPKSFATTVPASNIPMAAPAPLPWLKPDEQEKVVISEEAAESSGSWFSDIFSSDEANEQKEEKEPEEAAKPDEPREAQVDVAEAIPVALSDDDRGSADAIMVGTPATIASSAETAPKEKAVNQPGWLNVQPFLDKERAERFWSELRKKAPSQARRLDMKVLYPVVSNDVPKVILNLGRFESEAEASDFCREHIMPASRYLECIFSAIAPGDDYSTTYTAPVNLEEPESSLYWVEVLNARNQDVALEQWEKIRTDHDDVLANLRSQITTSFSDPGHYVVRIGPITSRRQADGLCNTLKSRKLSCKLLSL